jgi:hypothetical protein
MLGCVYLGLAALLNASARIIDPISEVIGICGLEARVTHIVVQS